MTEYRWALPSVLLGDGEEGRPVKRSTRDWVVDTVMFLLAGLVAVLSLPDITDVSYPVQVTEQVLGGVACVLVWLRRRWPVMLAVVLMLLSGFFVLIGGPAIVALFTVAVHRPFKISGPILALYLVSSAPYAYFRPDRELDHLGTFAFAAAIGLAVFAWGLLVRARRQLVWSLRQQAEIAAVDAKRLERERIAREMHDVLAHRLSMLSLHAGALEFRPDAPAEDVAQAAARSAPAPTRRCRTCARSSACCATRRNRTGRRPFPTVRSPR